jgi:hypothetical protein
MFSLVPSMPRNIQPRPIAGRERGAFNLPDTIGERFERNTQTTPLQSGCKGKMPVAKHRYLAVTNHQAIEARRLALHHWSVSEQGPGRQATKAEARGGKKGTAGEVDWSGLRHCGFP